MQVVNVMFALTSYNVLQHLDVSGTIRKLNKDKNKKLIEKKQLLQYDQMNNFSGKWPGQHQLEKFYDNRLNCYKSHAIIFANRILIRIKIIKSNQKKKASKILIIRLRNIFK